MKSGNEKSPLFCGLCEHLPELRGTGRNYLSGRYWIRTSDFHRVKMAL